MSAKRETKSACISAVLVVSLLFILLLLLLLLLLYYRTFVWLAGAWLGDPAYSHGFLVPLISGFVAWTKRDELLKVRTAGEGGGGRGGGRGGRGGRGGGGLLVLAAGLLVYAVCFFWRAQFGLALSFLLVLSGLVLYFGGAAAMRTLLFPVCFLVFGIPLPFLPRVTTLLQSFSARYTSLALGALGVPIKTVGAEIQLGSGEVFVIGVPCSGMHTLISLLAVAAVLAYLLKCRPPSFYRKAVLFSAAFPIALFANVTRLVALLLIADRYGGEVAMRYFHDYSSLLLFAVALLLLAVCSRCLGCGLRRD